VPTGLRKLSHQEARSEQREYWASKSPQERLAAMTRLNERMRAMPGIVVDGSDWTIRFVQRVFGQPDVEHELPARLRNAAK
jgi:hypothetical protein